MPTRAQRHASMDALREHPRPEPVVEVSAPGRKERRARERAMVHRANVEFRRMMDRG